MAGPYLEFGDAMDANASPSTEGNIIAELAAASPQLQAEILQRNGGRIDTRDGHRWLVIPGRADVQLD